MLVAAFAGYELTMRAYETAIAERYRFYSYGDADGAAVKFRAWQSTSPSHSAGRARAGTFVTIRTAPVDTPAFMAVGTLRHRQGARSPTSSKRSARR
jgi:hypothetical protein